MSTRTPDHITLCTDIKSATGIDIKMIGSSEVNMDKYPLKVEAELLARVKKDEGGKGYFGLKTNGILLGFMEFDNSSPEQKSLILEDFPGTGQVTLELLIKGDGVGTVYLTGASLQIS